MNPTSRIGKYELQGQLGVGDMSTVYKGWDPAIGRSVAIKAINSTLYQGSEFANAMSRFRREAHAIGRLVHPRIVQIYDYVEDEQGAYIVMELVNGKALSKHLELGDSYDIHEVERIILQILDGIGYAHGQGVVHRNIKPSNILVNIDGRLKINDFSLAHVESSTLTQVGDLLGTPHYMAPEQFSDAKIDGRADLFAIGVIAYQLLTGQRPFKGDMATFMHQLMNEQPTDPSLLNPRLAKSVDEVLKKALAKDREERYQTAREFSDAFKRAIDESLNLGANRRKATTLDGDILLNAGRLLNVDGVQPVVNSLDELSDLNVEGSIKFDTRIKKACLLIVDDDERILTALKSVFSRNYHVFSTTDGHKALEFMGRHHMHVIISDQRMPGMTGVELLRQSREVSPRSVRILLTGYSDLAAIVGSINDGEVYRFISKPWDNQALQTIVAEAVTIGLELADTREAALTLPEHMSAGVLVVDEDEEIFRVTRELLGSLCPVLYAADAVTALNIMQQQEVAVVLADVGTGGEQLTVMLKILKQEFPQVLTIVTTRETDAAQAVDLINRAQVFRLLSKPMKVGLLKRNVHAALQRYLIYRQEPKLAMVHKVDDSEQLRSSKTGLHILEGLKSLRSSWFGAS